MIIDIILEIKNHELAEIYTRGIVLSITKPVTYVKKQNTVISEVMCYLSFISFYCHQHFMFPFNIASI